MPHVQSDDARIFYQVRGSGPDVVLLHPFPVNHHFWDPVAPMLEGRYRLILPDMRGHGQSEVGEGVPTMARHAADVLQVCDDAGASRAVFAGVSFAGYVLMEFWRRWPERVRALIFCNTRAEADTEQARQGRRRSAQLAREQGTEAFIETVIPNLFAGSTRRNRPDVVEAGKAMMRAMAPEAIASVVLGIGERPDSVATLPSMRVPALVIAGEEDTFTPVEVQETIRKNLPQARLEVIPRGGHYSAFEQPEHAARALRQFLDSLPA